MIQFAQVNKYQYNHVNLGTHNLKQQPIKLCDIHSSKQVINIASDISTL